MHFFSQKNRINRFLLFFIRLSFVRVSVLVRGCVGGNFGTDAPFPFCDFFKFPAQNNIFPSDTEDIHLPSTPNHSMKERINRPKQEIFHPKQISISQITLNYLNTTRFTCSILQTHHFRSIKKEEFHTAK
mmetsp:Transcript_27917/g.37111  ORF Transcript_27917/g.37111 Transcript_27917/m.37111 type:complete len:130 (+) Transcript_27917:310-699(+)